jgi:hypothetical protein
MRKNMKQMLTGFYLVEKLKRQLGVFLLLSIIAISGCKKFLDLPPPITSLGSDNVYATDATASAVLIGIYTSMALNSPTSGVTFNAEPLLTALSSDELTLFGGAANANTTLLQFYEDNVQPGNPAQGSSFWAYVYSQIYVCNISIERLQSSTTLTPAVKQQLIGEAKFLRAYFYFYLVNLYGDVPLAISSNVTINASLARTQQTQVYQQIIADLVSAQSLLSDGYVAADGKTQTPERVRPNKWAATALLARVYLYQKDWPDAVTQSTAVINNNAEYSLVPLNNVFLKNSNETIWSLQPVNFGWNTEEARFFILPASGPTSNVSPPGGYPVYLSTLLLNAFEPNDQRLIAWVNSVMVNGTVYYFPYKYKSATLNAAVTEYTVEFRLGEQYLIRSEAEANNNDPTDAVKDLNVIRVRAGLPAYSGATDQTSLLTAVLHEREVELFTEGHRWLDLKRTNTANIIMNAVAPDKGTTWNANWQLYPIPAYDILQDGNIKQNPGY